METDYMKKKSTFSLVATHMLFVLLLSGLMIGKAYATTELVQWRTLKEGKSEARERNMPVLVDFYVTENCPRCEALDREVYVNIYITNKINEKFVPVRVDLDKKISREEQALMDELKTGGECVLAFLNADGTIIKDSKGATISSMEMLPPNKYNWFMDQALANLNK
jgi:hypothetical protein